VIKSYLIESSHEDEKEIITNDESEHDSQNVTSKNQKDILTKSTRARRLSTRYQNVADIIVFLQDESDLSISTLTLTFSESRRKEINDLVEEKIFEMIIISEVFEDVRIFNFRFVDEIKHSSISQTYEKFRLVIQVYNNHEKVLVLIQASIIQRMSQRIILIIAASINYDLYLRDIIQAYTQSKTSLNRQFFIRSSSGLRLSDDSILRIIKLLYDVSKAKTH
jgi:hypothetical protein